MKLDFIFRLLLCSREIISFNIICLNVLEGIKQFYLLMWFKKPRLETHFIGSNVNALLKTSNCENLVLYFSETVQKIAAFAMLFLFSVTKQSPENGFGFPNDQKYPRYPLVLKFNITLARLMRLVVKYFLKGNSFHMIGACNFMPANETRDLMWIGSPIQNNC